MFHLWLVGSTMLPMAVFVATVAIKSMCAGLLGGIIGGGVFVAVLGFFASYSEMVGLVSVESLLLLVLVGVWTSIFTGIGYRLYRRSSNNEQHSPPDSQ